MAVCMPVVSVHYDQYNDAISGSTTPHKTGHLG